jgi:hypothetical protein
VEGEVPGSPRQIRRGRQGVRQGDARDACIHQHQAPDLSAEKGGISIGDPGPDVMGYKEVLANAELLKEPVHPCGQRFGVISADRTIGVALARQVRRDDPVVGGEQRNQLPPGEPAFRKPGEQDDDLSIIPSSADVMQLDAVDGLETVPEPD